MHICNFKLKFTTVFDGEQRLEVNTAHLMPSSVAGHYRQWLWAESKRGTRLNRRGSGRIIRSVAVSVEWNMTFAIINRPAEPEMFLLKPGRLCSSSFTPLPPLRRPSHLSPGECSTARGTRTPETHGQLFRCN